MIPSTANELKQHSDNLADFAKGLNKLNGTGKALVNAAVAVVALIPVIIFLPPMFAQIV
jgi:hypothetical protein